MGGDEEWGEMRNGGRWGMGGDEEWGEMGNGGR